MAVQAGKNLVFKLTDAGSSVRTLSTYVSKITTGLKGHTLVDVTAGGDSGHTYASDELEDGQFTVEMWYDPTATTGPFVVCEGVRDATSATAFEIGPAGSTSTYTKLSGNCWVEDLTVDTPVGEVVKMTASFKVDGAYTVGVYS